MTHSIRSTGYTSSPALSKTAVAGVLTVTAAGIAMLAGLGSRWDLWHYTTSLLLLRGAVMGGILSFAVSLAGAVITRPGTWRGGFRRSFFGLAISFFVISFRSVGTPRARSAADHDVPRTPTTRPIQAILPLPEKASISDYGGPEVARLRRGLSGREASHTLDPSGRGHCPALAAARSLGWTIMQRDRQEGRIEAMDRTIWFGFTDVSSFA